MSVKEEGELKVEVVRKEEEKDEEAEENIVKEVTK